MKVHPATPYLSANLGSRGKANYMYLRQFQFPDTFSEGDKIASVDSDRIDFEHLWRCFRKHAKIASNIEEWKFEDWALKESEESVMKFLKDVFALVYPWTGYRIMASVGSNGHIIWHFALFAKHPESDTVVYTGSNAPNVKNKNYKRE